MEQGLEPLSRKAEGLGLLKLHLLHERADERHVVHHFHSVGDSETILEEVDDFAHEADEVVRLDDVSGDELLQLVGKANWIPSELIGERCSCQRPRPLQACVQDEHKQEEVKEEEVKEEEVKEEEVKEEEVEVTRELGLEVEESV
eukprot:768216-Hanusia_phi.AAC.3